MNKSSQKQSKSAERNESSLSEPPEKNMHPSCSAKKSSKEGIIGLQEKLENCVLIEVVPYCQENNQTQKTVFQFVTVFENCFYQIKRAFLRGLHSKRGLHYYGAPLLHPIKWFYFDSFSE